jgi:hypothetical protein
LFALGRELRFGPLAHRRRVIRGPTAGSR